MTESTWHPERVARLALTSIAEPGDADMGWLVSELGAAETWRRLSADAAVPLDRATAEAAQARWRPRVAHVEVADQQGRAQRVGATFLIPTDELWPASVDDLDVHAPLGLWVRGDAGLLCAASSVAVVGARAATGYGEHVTGELAAEVALAGVVTVSGGAYGIDGAAHRATLAVGGGTIAVLAGGVDRVYPAGHANLLASIARDGAVVSELPLGVGPTKWRFLLRNRIIAALAQATVVVEAGWRSGSLNTAAHAASLGRPLGAVPGPITSPASAGCHRLLREFDAMCITSASDVEELIGGIRATTAEEHEVGGYAGDPVNRVHACLRSRAPRTTEDLAQHTGLAIAVVESALGLLQLNGRARAVGEGWVQGPEGA